MYEIIEQVLDILAGLLTNADPNRIAVLIALCVIAWMVTR